MMIVVPTIAKTYYISDPTVGAAIIGFVITITVSVT
jgi:hypothetical protein